MPIEPRQQQTIYESLRESLTGKIPDLTNFTDTSFNWVWTQGFSTEFREKELDIVAAYLSGLIDYAGGPVDEDDLEDLGIADVADPDEINERLDDEDLDELVKIVGVERDMGSKATGVVTFTTQTEQTDIPEGTPIGLQPEEDGTFLNFVTTENASTAAGDTTVDVNIEAEAVGNEYNVGSGQITYLPNPPTGVLSAVNNNATEGGENVETNDELRTRAKNAIFDTSGGGTVRGVEGFIESNVEGVDEANIIEFFDGDTWHGSYSHAHVVVSGGTESDILDAIESSRPVGIQHVFIEAKNRTIRFDLSLSGTDIDAPDVRSSITNYINSRGLGGEIVDVRVIQEIMNSDDDIEDIENLDTIVENEEIFFDPATDVYNLSQGVPMEDDGIIEVTGTLSGSQHTFVEDTDYQEVDDDSDSSDDSIDWSLGGDEPDTTSGNTVTLTYESDTDKYLFDDALLTDGITQVDGTLNGSPNTFVEDTDYQEIDVRGDGVVNGIDWSIGGDTPDDGTDFTVTYDAGTAFEVTYRLQPNTDITFDEDEQPVTGTINITVV
jgi:hypothetical protein